MELNDSVKNKIKPYLLNINTECINYPTINKDGYGVFQSYINNKKIHYLMHRVSYQLYYKEDINSENIICHKCDNPGCINPLHLFKGTHADNVKDRVNKNRSAKGENNGRYIDGRTLVKISKPHTHNRKFSVEEVKLIRKYRSQGLTLNEITNKISKATLSNIKDICSNRTYFDSIYYE